MGYLCACWEGVQTWALANPLPAVTLMLLAVVLAVTQHAAGPRRGRPISYPGEARKHRLRRVVSHARKTTVLEADWQFACDGASHDISSRRAPRFAMTGESAGRQIWFQQSDVDGDDAELQTPNDMGEDDPTLADVFEEDAENEQDSGPDGMGFCAARNPNSADKVFRAHQLRNWDGPVPDEDWTPQSARDACHKGIQFYQMLQCDDGHWAGDYGGPIFLTPGIVIVMYITKAPFPLYKRRGLVAYFRNHQQYDGGWGTHIESPSTMFGTVLVYVALRLLGVPKEEPFMQDGHRFMRDHGGALFTSSWAKFWLAALGVYDWKGINSIPAEMWLLPRWFPFHPGKLWCHCRMVYLPMCYLYCKRFTPDVSKDPLLQSLREEIYNTPYDKINWDAHRHSVSDFDNYSPVNPIMAFVQNCLSYYEACPINIGLRDYALKFVMEYIHAEDVQTNYVDIGPVNKALNMLSVFAHVGGDVNHEWFQRHIPRVDDYLWVAEDGMKMQGYNGSQCWDTSFAIQAIVESGLGEDFADCVVNVHHYLDKTQIPCDEDNNERYFRHVSKGGWPFSTAAHGWPISDCTGEGLKSAIALSKLGFVREACQPISKERLENAVNVILTLHNKDGGWATYENNRGDAWYEWLNPSEVFGDIMIDYSYVECSSAAITALVDFAELYPNHRRAEVRSAIQAGREFIRSIQREDGSWYGSWGVCFCYATWFGIEGLLAAGESKTSEPVLKAAQFILSKQNRNGGWGETIRSCFDKEYSGEGAGNPGDGNSDVVQTAWALLGLLAANRDGEHKDAIDRGVRFLMDMQLPTGDWDQARVSGVFNRSCSITYTAYRNVFPIWALGRYANTFEKEE